LKLSVELTLARGWRAMLDCVCCMTNERARELKGILQYAPARANLAGDARPLRAARHPPWSPCALQFDGYI
jgi:hypothetical protein